MCCTLSACTVSVSQLQSLGVVITHGFMVIYTTHRHKNTHIYGHRIHTQCDTQNTHNATHNRLVSHAFKCDITETQT